MSTCVPFTEATLKQTTTFVLWSRISSLCVCARVPLYMNRSQWGRPRVQHESMSKKRRTRSEQGVGASPISWTGEVGGLSTRVPFTDATLKRKKRKK